MALIDKLAQQALQFEPLVDLLDPVQCIALSPGLRTMFRQLKTGRAEGETVPRSVILNPLYQIVHVNPVEPHHFFRRVLSNQHVPQNFTVVNLRSN